MNIWMLNPPFHPKYSRPQRSPAVTKSGTIYFPIWQAFCTGVLEQAGHAVTFTDAPARGHDRHCILQMARDLQPGLIVMDTSTPSIENDLAVAQAIKQVVPDTFIVVVGTHVSALAEETLQKGKAVDAVARREYEYTVRDLAACLAGMSGKLSTTADLEGIQGLSFRSGQEIAHNPDRPFIANLDELPWVSKVYRKHLDIRDYFNPNAPFPMVTLMTSRGCPFRCNFCVYPQTLTGRKFRFRSIDDVVAEIAFIKNAFPQAKSLFFEDDTLTANKKRCMQLAEAMIAAGVTIPWVANSRIDLDLEAMEKLKASGCRELCVGFESGDQDVLKTMKKGIQTRNMFRFIADAKKAGILIHGCFIVGFPGETRAQIEKTIALALALKPDTVQFYPVMVYPGTEAYTEYQQKKWITAQDYTRWLTPEGLHNCVVRNQSLAPEELVELCDLGRRRFYLRPTYMAYKSMQLLKSPAEIVRTLKATRTFLKHLILGSKVKRAGD